MMSYIKKLIIIGSVFIISCDTEPNEPQHGCLTGINKSTNVRGLLRCCTRQEFLAGSDVSNGGTSNWDVYTQHQWKAVKNCNECQ
jgi:hypothetical protein